MDDKEQKREFIRFVSEFGTHFATKILMGVKLYSERRYSLHEKGQNTDADLMKCNTLMAAKLIGLQGRRNLDQCKDKSLLQERSSNSNIQTHIMTSHGSYGTKAMNISQWSKQIQDLEDTGNLYPRALKRELVLIIRFSPHKCSRYFNF